MHLDMLTISAVNIALTAMLGFVLVFTWARERTYPLVGWWGLAQLIQSLGTVVAIAAAFVNNAEIVTIGTAAMIVAEALKWKAARQFENRQGYLLLILAGPAAFLIAAHSGYFSSFDDRLILVCTFMAIYNFAAAIEFARGRRERLQSRWAGVVLLLLTALAFLSWLPLDLTRPIREAAFIFASDWFPAVILLTLLLRTALAFLVLAVAKEREELKQRTGALTDPLTGLPNRRALFEAADALGQRRGGIPKAAPISVLLFDLDRFKETNDTYGHLVGDRVLRIFASTLSERLDQGSIIARVGGEEFAAILPFADQVMAVEAGETVRSAFAASAAMVDGVAIGGTVSVGAASSLGVDCDLNSLFRLADTALYAAKHAGRNRVELVGPEDATDIDALNATVRSSRSQRKAVTPPIEYSAA
jgi:diguanylate cyclase (GGDEF)-like protein